MRSNKLQSAGQMQNVNCAAREEIPMGAVWRVPCARGKSTKCHTKSELTHARPHLNKFCKISCTDFILFSYLFSPIHMYVFLGRQEMEES